MTQVTSFPNGFRQVTEQPNDIEIESAILFSTNRSGNIFRKSVNFLVKRQEYIHRGQRLRKEADLRKVLRSTFKQVENILSIIYLADGSPITQTQQIEIFQDTSQSSLEQYIRSQYPSQTTRFGKLLLMLSSLRKVEPAVTEQLFFADVLRGASMGDVLKKMLTSGSCTQPTVAFY